VRGHVRVCVLYTAHVYSCVCVCESVLALRICTYILAVIDAPSVHRYEGALTSILIRTYSWQDYHRASMMLPLSCCVTPHAARSVYATECVLVCVLR